MMERKTGHITAVPMSVFGKINTVYDEDEALPKPRRRWWEEAQCRTVKVEDRERIFFPVSVGRYPYKRALNYCNNCPVKKDCLDDALRDEGFNPRNSIFGMRGGLMPAERHAILQRYRAQGLIQRRSNVEGVRRLGRFDNQSNYTQEHGQARRERNQQERENNQ